MRFLHLLIITMCVLSSSILLTAVQCGVYKLSSIQRKNSQKVSGDCFLFKVSLNKYRKPSNLRFTGHCCDDTKSTDIKVVLNGTRRGLEATFQWYNDTTYYLTAKRIGNPIHLEKVNLGQVSDDQRFILANPQGQCQDCVTIKSVSTKLYLSTSGTGRIMTTTNTSSNRAWFDLYTCGQALMAICNSTIAC